MLPGLRQLPPTHPNSGNGFPLLVLVASRPFRNRTLGNSVVVVIVVGVVGVVMQRPYRVRRDPFFQLFDFKIIEDIHVSLLIRNRQALTCSLHWAGATGNQEPPHPHNLTRAHLLCPGGARPAGFWCSIACPFNDSSDWGMLPAGLTGTIAGAIRSSSSSRGRIAILFTSFRSRRARYLCSFVARVIIATAAKGLRRGPVHICYLSLLGLVAGTSFGLLWPGACAGLPDGNCPGGKLALDGAIRSSTSSTFRLNISMLLHLPSLLGGISFGGFESTGNNLQSKSSERRAALGHGHHLLQSRDRVKRYERASSSSTPLTLGPLVLW